MCQKDTKNNHPSSEGSVQAHHTRRAETSHQRDTGTANRNTSKVPLDEQPQSRKPEDSRLICLTQQYPNNLLLYWIRQKG